jgi:hypothetical protein
MQSSVAARFAAVPVRRLDAGSLMATTANNKPVEQQLESSARVFQWLSRPVNALQQLMVATKPKGRVVILDYNHEKIAWKPSPPLSVRNFYDAFLQWRADANMDNAIADRLPALFEEVGFINIVTTPQHETTQRGGSGF